MTKPQFNEMAKNGYNLIPVARQILADVDTPVSVYAKLAHKPYTYLFESVQGGEKWARYSMIGLACKKVIKIFGLTVHVEVDGELVEQFDVEDPLAFIDEYRSTFNVPDIADLPSFQGGLVGYFAYDTVRYVESRLKETTPTDTLNVPDIVLMESTEVVVFDNLAGTLTLISMAKPEEAEAFDVAQARLDDLVVDLKLKSPELATIELVATGKSAVEESDFKSGFSQENFERAVNTIKNYVLDGDVMQVVISQRLTIDFDDDPLSLYRALRSLNPSPYMYMLNLNDMHIVGSSPEVLARSENGTVAVRPIAGTRKRGRDEAEDLAMEKELLADPKEIAEHLMLIDLGRNDVGRIAKTGSVRVTDQMQIERYSHVMHIVSNVEGQLQEGFSATDVLKATLPAGTLSGAPKVRAMEIIDELEPVKRGVYGGAVGYISWSGNVDTAIAIRTAVIKDGQLHVQAGAGVVADSIPALEWKETMNKARAIFKAVAMVKSGANNAATKPARGER
ncbi:MAG: anthranilate synthase component I [Sinobacterium sp.]|nr:anthranilate synthase component I [Sinobacterium sp.]